MNSDEPTLDVFVYGTLKLGGRYHAAYCGEALRAAIPAIAPGLLYHLPHPHNYPAMTEGPGWVHGFCLSFDPAQAETVLHRLDDLEDYNPQRSPQQNLYDRRWIQLCHPSKKPLGQAWGYIMSPETVRSMQGIAQPDGDWNAERFW